MAGALEYAHQRGMVQRGINPENVLLHVGGGMQFTATPRSDGGKVDWGSSDTAIATVSSTGLVTTVAPDTATIAACFGGWRFDVVSIGYPSVVRDGKSAAEPHNLAPGWVCFDFQASLAHPVRMINDAVYLGTSSFTSTYGAVGSVIVVLVWVHYSSQIVLLGAEVTRASVEQFGPRPPPADFATTDRDAKP